MKKIKILACFLSVIMVSLIFSGCTSMGVSLFLTAYPSKTAYEVGDELDLNGLKVERLNGDGTFTMQRISDDEVEPVDLSTPGEKTVRIVKGEMSTTFKVYVANVVVTVEDNVREKINSADDGDIVYFKRGEYQSTETNNLSDIVINKSLTLIGDNPSETVFHGNFLVGVNKVGSNYVEIADFEKVNFFNIRFKLDYQLQNGFLTYEGNYGENDLNGAIKSFATKNLQVKNCSFSGYSYGINCRLADGLTVVKNTFRDIKIFAIKVDENTKNSSICQNIMMDIATSSLAFEDSHQGNVGAISLGFGEEGNAGVIVSRNTFARIALMQGDFVYVSPNSYELIVNETPNLSSMSYVSSSAIIFLRSSAGNNLNVGGVILSMNNYGTTLKNIAFGTNENNLINQNGIFINEI